MAATKNALIRYKVLDNCFRNTGKRYFIGDLISECETVLSEIDPSSSGISRRQIFDDIAFMESAEGWAIDLLRHKEGKRVFYRYADPSFSINNMPLNEVEINQLKSAVDILSQFKGMPQFEWINELIPKLKQGVSTSQTNAVIMEFDSNEFLKGKEHLGFLYNAIFYKKVISIQYQPFENETAFNLIIHPYFLKQYNNRWFLFGFNPQNGKYDWNLAIDRILSAKETIERYHENTEINWHEYFEDIIGVTKPVDGEIENIVLHFYGKTGKYIETKPLHESQIGKWLDSDIFEVKMKLYVNYELERLILSYADSVRVLQPIRLAERLKLRYQNAIMRI
jgi:predicted DNA-binding transcriptional regulator YafY